MSGVVLPTEANPLPTLHHVGWTASRHGLTPIQEAVARIVLVDLRDRRGAMELHHGDCCGGDLEGATEARRFGYRIVGHPPVLDILRAHFPSDAERAPLTYLARDRRIVEQSDVLLAWPGTEREVTRSGTWYTINYARQLNRPRLVIAPSGRIIESVGVEGLFTAMPAGDVAADHAGKESA